MLEKDTWLVRTAEKSFRTVAFIVFIYFIYEKSNKVYFLFLLVMEPSCRGENHNLLSRLTQLGSKTRLLNI